MLMILIIDGEIQAFNKWNSFDIANITAYSNLQYRCHVNHTPHEICFNGLKVAFICFSIWEYPPLLLPLSSIFPPTYFPYNNFSTLLEYLPLMLTLEKILSFYFPLGVSSTSTSGVSFLLLPLERIYLLLLLPYLSLRFPLKSIFLY